MNLTKFVTSLLFSVTFAIPAMASSDWVNDFLHRFDPSATGASRPESATTPNVSQFFRTGEVPVSINDVNNMMLDNNLDIRANRLAPRSPYLQSLVLYRALLPALRVSGNVARNTALSTTQLNGASSRTQDTGFFDANVSQLLHTGTSL